MEFHDEELLPSALLLRHRAEADASKEADRAEQYATDECTAAGAGDRDALVEFGGVLDLYPRAFIV
ncbi:hypothetical protein CIK73_17045, partial [Brachybacterium alimentarium]